MEMLQYPAHYGTIVNYLNLWNNYVTQRRQKMANEGIDNYEAMRASVDKYFTPITTTNESACNNYQYTQALYTRLFNLEEETNYHSGRRRAVHDNGDPDEDRTINVGDNYRLLPAHQMTLLYKHNFYNDKFMEFLRCHILRIFKNRSLDVLSRFWLHNIKRIGESSVDGEVKTAIVGGYSEILAFKISKVLDAEYASKYEAIISQIINRARRRGIVNFVYTYGIIRCEGKHLCNRPNNLMIIQEFVKGVPYYGYVRKIKTLDEFMASFAQLVLALKFAYEQYRFQHLDLHAANVMERDINGNTYSIPYPQPNGTTYYVDSSKISTVIDFGRSTIRSPLGKNEQIYYSDLPHFYPNGLAPLADIYRLLGALYGAAEYNIGADNAATGDPLHYDNGDQVIKYGPTDPVIIQAMERLFSFFLDGEPQANATTQAGYEQVLRAWHGSYFILKSKGNNTDPTFDDFIDYIINDPLLGPHWNNVVSSQPRHPILGCGQQCVIPSAVQQLIATSNQNIDGVLDYLIRVNEGLQVHISEEDWPKLLQALHYLLTSQDLHKITGVNTLLKTALQNNRITGVSPEIMNRLIRLSNLQ